MRDGMRVCGVAGCGVVFSALEETGIVSLTPYYQDEAVTLFHGDCRDILPGLEAVDHVITDPPYDEHTHSKQRRGAAAGTGHQFGFGHGGSAGISTERHIGFGYITTEDLLLVSTYAARLARRWVLIFCSMEQQNQWMSALTESGLEHVRFGLWHKPGATPQFTGDRPGTVTEAIEIAHRPGKKKWNGGGSFGMWTAPIVKAQTGDRCHPTQKPEALMAQLITDFTDDGDLVLDPFAGSGTTAVAAKRLGRRCILIEREEKYCEVATQRLQQGALSGLFASSLSAE